MVQLLAQVSVLATNSVDEVLSILAHHGWPDSVLAKSHILRLEHHTCSSSSNYYNIYIYIYIYIYISTHLSQCSLKCSSTNICFSVLVTMCNSAATVIDLSQMRRTSLPTPPRNIIGRNISKLEKMPAWSFA